MVKDDSALTELVNIELTRECLENYVLDLSAVESFKHICSKALEG